MATERDFIIDLQAGFVPAFYCFQRRSGFPASSDFGALPPHFSPHVDSVDGGARGTIRRSFINLSPGERATTSQRLCIVRRVPRKKTSAPAALMRRMNILAHVDGSIGKTTR
jgi:hypothetical protein